MLSGRVLDTYNIPGHIPLALYQSEQCGVSRVVVGTFDFGVYWHQLPIPVTVQH
jgi:hypothetical protein